MRIVYLKTDIHDQPIVAGGSVTHMIGIVRALVQLGHEVHCATTIKPAELATISLASLCDLRNPSWLIFLRWKLNCLLSTLFFFLPSGALFVARSLPVSISAIRLSI